MQKCYFLMAPIPFLLTKINFAIALWIIRKTEFIRHTKSYLYTTAMERLPGTAFSKENVEYLLTSFLGILYIINKVHYELLISQKLLNNAFV